MASNRAGWREGAADRHVWVPRPPGRRHREPVHPIGPRDCASTRRHHRPGVSRSLTTERARSPVWDCGDCAASADCWLAVTQRVSQEPASLPASSCLRLTHVLVSLTPGPGREHGLAQRDAEVRIRSSSPGRRSAMRTGRRSGRTLRLPNWLTAAGPVAIDAVLSHARAQVARQ